MNKRMLGLLGEMDSDVDRIMKRSSRAICGPQERQVVVRDSEVSKTKAKLKSAGFFIVGTGPGGFGKTNIWFNPIGGF